VYASASAAPAAAGLCVLKNAYIDFVGEQFVSFDEPVDGVPVVKPDQPSLDAGDPSGLEQLVCIQRFAIAGPGLTVASASASTPVSAATVSIALTNRPACV
jgi:hypothetical protein